MIWMIIIYVACLIVVGTVVGLLSYHLTHYHLPLHSDKSVVVVAVYLIFVITILVSTILLALSSS